MSAGGKARQWLLPVLAKLPFGVYLLLGIVTLLLCIWGMILFLITAAGNVYSAAGIAEDAVPIRGVNGLAVDAAGNIYEGTAGFSSIQMFDGQGQFVRRYCIPVRKAVNASFYWSLDESGLLTVYTYRDYARLSIQQDGQAVEMQRYADRDAFEAAVKSAGLIPNQPTPAICVREDATYRARTFGRVDVCRADGTNDTVHLEVPHWPPPVPVCWAMAAAGFLGTIALVGVSLQVEEYRRTDKG